MLGHLRCIETKLNAHMDTKLNLFIGEILFKCHGMVLKTELQNLLYELVQDDVPQWKQMRVLEVVSAVLAETLIEMGVVIITEPPEIHWSKDVITKPVPPPRARRGKQVTKNSHGIFRKLVADLAPTLPAESKHGKKGVFKAPLKKTQAPKGNTKKISKSLQIESPPDDKEEIDDESDENPMQHKGLPVQGRRGSLKISIKFSLMSYSFHRKGISI